MKTYHFKALLQKTGWIENASITVDDAGIIQTISDEGTFDNTIKINGYAIPGFQNAHSHAFQYAMAGLTESHPSSKNTPDDFWSWREAMYGLALELNPDQMEDIATMLYAEMARHGYTNVVEFHYLHHDAKGNRYENLAEMGTRMISAAKTVGIGITLVPIFYQKGGFGLPPNPRQKRFISATIHDYLELLTASEKACEYYEYANIGMGMHSLRGVEPSCIREIAQTGPQNIPFHIHVAEQLQEIEDSMAYLHKRPATWLLDNIDLTERFHLVHATHLSDKEVIGLAKSKANVVLCPSTEGNLGDGLFPLSKFQENGGAWSIGTDSNIGLNPMEELRILDYGQRLNSHKRNIFYAPDSYDSGIYALNMSITSGRKAGNNFNSEFFAVGEPLNASIFDAAAPLLANTSLLHLASTLVYATDTTMQIGTICNGKIISDKVENKIIKEKFFTTMDELKNR